MAGEVRSSTGMLLVQMLVSTALVVLFGWLYLGPKHIQLGSWEMMLYFGFFPAFVIYDGVRLARRFRQKQGQRKSPRS